MGIMVKTILWVDIVPELDIVLRVELENAFQIAVDKAISQKYRGEGEFGGSINKRVEKTDNPKDIIQVKVDENDIDRLNYTIDIPGWRWV